MKVEVYADDKGRWHWRVLANNKKITAASGESFAEKHNAIRGAKAFVRSLISANFKNTLVFNVQEEA